MSGRKTFYQEEKITQTLKGLIEIMMKMNVEKFLKTEFGAELENCIKCWDLYLTEKNYDSARLCQEQWGVYQMAVKQFYGIKYHFTRTDEYFGVVTEDGQWLFKIERGA